MRNYTKHLALILGCLGVSACGGGGAGSALPTSAGADSTLATRTRLAATAAPTGTATGGSPTRVQQFSYATASGGGETSSTVMLGTTGSAHAAPKAGDLLVALIAVDNTGDAPKVTAPSGWTLAGNALDNAWVHQLVETSVVGATPPSSATFTYNGALGATITIVEVANSGGVDTVTSASANVGAPWTTTSGTGSAGSSMDLGIAFFSIDDSILVPSALSGYTMLSGVGRHGDGTANYGHSVGVYAANAALAAGAVPSQSISWGLGSGTEAVIGQQVLLKPTNGAPSTPTGGAMAAPTASANLNPSPATVQTIGSNCGTTPAFVNGVEYAAGWAPYSCTTSPWNQRVSGNPTYASYSSSVIAGELGGGNSQPVRDEEAGSYDVGHPIYYATASDPVVNLNCTNYCNHTDNGGYPATAHIPALARPAGGSDGHMAVIQPDGSEIDMWAATTPSGNWTTGSTISAQAIANCGSFTNGSGFTPNGPAATAGGACLGAGLLRATELAAGTIHHALFLVTQCANGWQYPAFPNASTNPCTSGTGPALGARLWYDVADATTNANTSLKPWEKAILNALHDYGGYLMDDIGGASGVSGIGLLAESGEAAYMFGQSDPFAALASAGWNSVSVSGALQLRWMGADQWNPSGVTFASHMHWLAPCSAQGSC
jgi:hypothetical protein